MNKLVGAVPDGYALISIEALKAWGKYDEVRNACHFPAEQAEQEPSIDFDKLHEMNMQYVECPACGSDMAMAYSPKSVEQKPIRFIWNGEGWIEADDYIWKTTDDHERRILYAAPVRTKDLTDEELNAMWYGNTKDGWLGLFRAVIAADREKNK